MLTKSAICVLVIVNTITLVMGDFHPEDGCNAVGGHCVLASLCPNSPHSSGLCPQQQSQGAECCDRVPESDKRCASHGGECSTDCPPVISHPDLECATGVCCIYLS
ncbi:U-scoloptoxin(19)-Sm1a [Onthophagus taurus]|uniref:U-scoloptoxin(19)-Sm1a n=1 Tax=Onthophagus taurus TaxID=166361 RepID=UPI000C20206C|nr:uncharacterized protein LOC111418016 [Onthophagus taurus]